MRFCADIDGGDDGEAAADRFQPTRLAVAVVAVVGSIHSGLEPSCIPKTALDLNFAVLFLLSLMLRLCRHVLA